MSYKEPAPILHDKDPLESMMKRFHVAAEYLELDEEVYNVLKSSVKKIIVSLPISMDDGSIRVFEGYRVIHSNILGPSKGGIRYDPSVNINEVTAAEFAACAEKKPYLPHPMSMSLNNPKSSGSLQGLNLSELTLIKFVN